MSVSGFVLEQALSVRALQEMVSAKAPNTVSGAGNQRGNMITDHWCTFIIIFQGGSRIKRGSKGNLIIFF